MDLIIPIIFPAKYLSHKLDYYPINANELKN